jgi:hypothetical protein
VIPGAIDIPAHPRYIVFVREMKTSKLVTAGVLLLFVSALGLSGQSLVEIAKKEKERREALKGKTGTTVTNADLVKTKKKPAVTQPGGEAQPAGESAPAEKKAPAALPSGAPSPLDLKAEQARGFEEGKAEIEGRIKAAQDLISLLKLKMNSLQQQFYNFNNTTNRDQIQRDISDTYLKLQSAQADEAKAKDELNKYIAAGPGSIK